MTIVLSMDSLENILSRYKAPEQPELEAIKKYVDEHYHIAISVALQGESIVATVPGAALANTLRLQTTKIKAACQIEKRLVFRIG
jgi:hypothetical protein